MVEVLLKRMIVQMGEAVEEEEDGPGVEDEKLVLVSEGRRELHHHL